MALEMSKVKILGDLYNVKDKQAREDLADLIASLGTAAYEDVLANIEAGEGKIIDAKTIKEYVDAQVGAIHKFDIVVVDALPTAAAGTMYKLYLIPTPGAEDGSKDEYITVRSGAEGSYTYKWEMIGSTKPELEDYVKKTTEIAGIDLQDDITAMELKGALDLKSLAYADTASGSTTLETINSITMNDLEVAGNAAVTATPTAATLTKADYTPAGSITGEAIKGGSIDVTLDQEDTAADISRADYTPAGTIAVTLKNNTVLGSVATAGTLPTKAADTFTQGSFTEGAFDQGSLPSFVEGAFTQGTLPTLSDATQSDFNTDGMKAHMASGAEITGGVDAETLIIERATTAKAVTDRGTFNQGTLPTKAADTWDAGTLPTKAADEFVKPTFTEGTFTQGAMPTFNEATVDVDTQNFTGTKETGLKVTAVNYDKAVVDEATFTPVAATLGFSGTKVEQALVTGVTYDKADAAAAFDVTVTPTTKTLTRTAKDIEVTVTPDA